jgi:succinate-acetate transporter protein
MFESDTMLGYSRYANLETIGYLSNFISVLSFVWVPRDTTLLLLPWNLTFGCCVQFVAGFIGFSRGETFESSSFLIFASFWSIWGSLRALGFTENSSEMSLGTGVGAFLLIGLVFVGLSITMSKTWTGIFVCFELFMITIILQLLGVSDADIAEKTIAVLLSLALLYAFLSHTLKLTYGRELLPSGRPILQISKINRYKDQMLWTSSRKASGVKQIAGEFCSIMDFIYLVITSYQTFSLGIYFRVTRDPLIHILLKK